MPASKTDVAKISALIHAHDDERRLGRLLETLRPCDEVVVIDHGSSDRTREVAREYGATVRAGVLGVKPGAYVADLKHDWVLCLLPCESLSEALETSLFEWKENFNEEQQPAEIPSGYCISMREERGAGWGTRSPEFRLVNRNRINWTDELPPNVCPGPSLSGEILRFSSP
ncbi:MAG: hypothetical protein JO041_12265 [Acidobacteria bacterium]|nr:hypothetical protein [Acidobacteriota bacterium]